MESDPVSDDDLDNNSIDTDHKGDNGPPYVYPEVVENPEEFAKDVSEQLIAMSSLWQGRLPRPETLRQFDQVVPGLAREIADDMLEDGRRIDRAMALDHEISTRVLDRIDRESEADISHRKYAFDRMLPALYLPFLLVVIVLFAPIGDVAKISIIGAILVASVAPICISLLRGRMGKDEGEVLKKVIPDMMEAMRRGSASVKKSNDPDKDESPSNSRKEIPKDLEDVAE